MGPIFVIGSLCPSTVWIKIGNRGEVQLTKNDASKVMWYGALEKKNLDDLDIPRWVCKMWQLLQKQQLEKTPNMNRWWTFVAFLNLGGQISRRTTIISSRATTLVVCEGQFEQQNWCSKTCLVQECVVFISSVRNNLRSRTNAVRHVWCTSVWVFISNVLFVCNSCKYHQIQVWQTD